MTALRKAALRFRAAVHLDLYAAMLGCAPGEFLRVWPKLWRTIVRRAIEDVNDVLADKFPVLADGIPCSPRTGLTDAEAMRHARLYQIGWAYPLSQEGNRLAEQARLERERIRRRGMDRVREREAQKWRAAEAAE
jgi:hypothetical protein